jgi:hypothetical protein
MRIQTAFFCAAILLGCAASSSAQAVSLKFDNGRVSLNAQEASIRTILAEWARVGGTRMVNHDRISGAPVTLELIDVPERQALDVLLRTTAGYVVTARDASSAGASRLGGVVILPTSSAPRNPAPITFANAPLVPPAQTFENMVQPRDDEQNQGNANRTVNVAGRPPGRPSCASDPAPRHSARHRRRRRRRRRLPDSRGRHARRRCSRAHRVPGRSPRRPRSSRISADGTKAAHPRGLGGSVQPTALTIEAALPSAAHVGNRSLSP